MARNSVSYGNLICVCYTGGMRGHAMAHIINMSPEVIDQRSPAIGENGDMHMTGVRYGRDPSAPPGAPELHPAMLADIMGTWFARGDTMNTVVADEFRKRIGYTMLETCGGMVPFEASLRSRRVAVADHILVKHQLELLPGTRCLVPHGSIVKAMRSWSDKFLLLHNKKNGYPNWHHVVSCMGHDPEGISRSKLKRLMHGMMQGMMDMQLKNMSHRDAIMVDISALFDPARACEHYVGMCRALELTPMVDEAMDFIGRYSERQTRHHK